MDRESRQKRMGLIVQVGVAVIVCGYLASVAIQIKYPTPTYMPAPSAEEDREFLARLVEAGLQPESRLEAFDLEHQD